MNDSPFGPSDNNFQHPVSIGRFLMMMAGIGMLFSPVTMFFHESIPTQSSTVCSHFAETMPELDPTVTNCQEWTP